MSISRRCWWRTRSRHFRGRGRALDRLGPGAADRARATRAGTSRGACSSRKVVIRPTRSCRSFQAYVRRSSAPAVLVPRRDPRRTRDERSRSLLAGSWNGRTRFSRARAIERVVYGRATLLLWTVSGSRARPDSMRLCDYLRVRRPFALCADAGEEGLGGLVGRVLRDELAAERRREHGRAERARAALRALDRRAQGVERRQPRLHLLPRSAAAPREAAAGTGNAAQSSSC